MRELSQGTPRLEFRLWYTLEEAAAHTGRSPRTIAWWCRRNPGLGVKSRAYCKRGPAMWHVNKARLDYFVNLNLPSVAGRVPSVDLTTVPDH